MSVGVNICELVSVGQYLRIFYFHPVSLSVRGRLFSAGVISQTKVSNWGGFVGEESGGEREEVQSIEIPHTSYFLTPNLIPQPHSSYLITGDN